MKRIRAKLIINQEILKNIKLREYSDDQKCFHNSDLYNHILTNIEYPDNTYYIVACKPDIPENINNIFGEYIRFRHVQGKHIKEILENNILKMRIDSIIKDTRSYFN